jgi:lipopolysaccharide heptosyltransferase II
LNTIVILRFGALGDVLLTTPLVRAVRHAYPKAAIHFVLSSDCRAALGENPHVDAVHEMDRHAPRLRELWRLGSDLRRLSPDLMIDLQPYARARMLEALVRARRVLRFRKNERVQPNGKARHVIYDYALTLSPLGVELQDDRLEYHPSLRAQQEASALLQDAKRPLVALNPGAGYATKQWPPERFGQLAARLAASGAQPVFVGSGGDLTLVEAALRHSQGAPILNLAGATGFETLAAVLASCDCVVSGDTGPMHLAAAVGTPVVSLFGATDPNRFGLLDTRHQLVQATGPECMPCRKKTCARGDFACMQSIEVERVLAAVLSQLEAGPPSSQPLLTG